MRYVSTFSGIEAASVAWGPLGWEPMCFSEVAPFPCAVLAERFPDVPNLGDITKIDWKEMIAEHGRPDVLVGGSPCQSFSVAGGRESLDGESRLLFEYLRAAEELVPRWVLWENVPGVLNTKDDAFGQLLDSLQDLGYVDLAWRVLDAQFFGVAQRRRRVFLVGHLGAGGGASAAVLFDSQSVRGNTLTSREKRKELTGAAAHGAGCGGFKFHQGSEAGGIGYREEQSPTLTADWHQPAVLSFDETQVTSSYNRSNPREGDPSPTLGTDQRAPLVCLAMASGAANAEVGEDMSPTITARSFKDAPVLLSNGDDVVAPLMARDSKGVGSQFVNDGKVLAEPGADGWTVRRLTPVECERLQGFPDGWTDVPYRGAEHPSDAPRYRALGNSMAVPVMRWIGERMEIVDGIASGAR